MRRRIASCGLAAVVGGSDKGPQDINAVVLNPLIGEGSLYWDQSDLWERLGSWQDVLNAESGLLALHVKTQACSFIYRMEEQTTFCDACHAIVSAIDSYYQFLKNCFASGEQPSDSPWRQGIDRNISLGTWEDLQSRLDCTSCQHIARRIVRDGREPSAQTSLGLECDGEQGLWIRGAEWLDEFYPHFWRLECPNPAHEVGRRFNPQQIDMSLLQQWVNCCEVSHGAHCHATELSSPLRQIYLIDVQMGCLTFAEMKTRYIALSYVWGNIETIQTTKGNLPHLKKPRSIDANTFGLMLPNTIKDALRLVSLLGERYLWVDRLCIVQDDLDTKQACLNAMGSIYSSAFLTIVAADGHNADHGLRGIGYGSENRASSCDIVRFPHETDVLMHCPRAWENSPWESRAWTFQEALFSRRILMFNGSISWICRTAIWQEHINSPTEDEAYATTHEPFEKMFPLAARNPAWPDLGRWADLVETYNKRKLTFDRDVVDAFAAVSSVFNSRFTGGLLWGIPEMFFDHCLLWRPKKVLRRRAYNHALSKIPFPSWSWTAWEGDIVLVGAPLILNNEPKSDGQAIKIQPLVRWYKSREPASPRFPVENTYSSSQFNRDRSRAQQIPTGWNQKQYSDGTFYYIHETVPTVRFRYPIPLKNENASPFSNENGRYLHFKSQRATLFLGRELENFSDNWTTFLACLVDDEGNWAGTIRLNTSRTDRLPPGLSYELIALSAAKAENSGNYDGKLDEWEIPERPQDSRFYEFYYVMWIEWERGIAYRKAIGTVYKPMWERQTREDIDVILG